MYAQQRFLAGVCSALGCLALAGSWAASGQQALAGDVITKPAPARASDSRYEAVDLFAGVKAGKLEAKLIPRDSKKARIFVTNKTSLPLNVKMPAALAGKPVLAQFLGGGGNMLGQGTGTGQGGMNPNNSTQMLGTGIRGNQGTGNGPAMFNVPPEKTAEFRVDCVCLEYGKPDPRPIVPYELLPADKVANPETVAMLVEFGRGKYSQRAAQAAAWHLANSMSWEKLEAIRGELLSLGLRAPYFTRQELDDAHKLVDAAKAAVKSQSPQTSKTAGQTASTSPGEQQSRAR